MNEKTLAYKGYCGSIEVSLEDNCLYGKVLFIHDLVTFEAESASALKLAFHEAVDYYIDKCAREGMSAEKPFSGSFNVRLTPELHRGAAMKAANSGQSLNDFVRESISRRLKDGVYPSKKDDS